MRTYAKALRSSALRFSAAAFIASLLGCSSFYIEVRPETLYEELPWKPVPYREVGRLEIKERGFTLIFFPIAIPNVVGSIDAAVQREGADAVADLEVESHQFNLVFFGWSTYVARGRLIAFE